MTSFRDYLRDHAKFYCRPVECHQRVFTTVTDVEVEQVLARWDSDHTVLEARHDAQMADGSLMFLMRSLAGVLYQGMSTDGSSKDMRKADRLRMPLEGNQV